MSQSYEDARHGWNANADAGSAGELQDGEYMPCDPSPTFPLVSTAIINQFLQQAETQDDTTFVRRWRGWIRQQASSESV